MSLCIYTCNPLQTGYLGDNMGVDAQKCQMFRVGVCAVTSSDSDSLLFCMLTWLCDLCTAKPIDPLQIRTITAASLPFFCLSLKMALSIPLFMPRLMWSTADRMSLGDCFIQRWQKERVRQNWKYFGGKKECLSLVNLSSAHTAQCHLMVITV